MELWEKIVKIANDSVGCSLATWKPIWVGNKKHHWICVEQFNDTLWGKNNVVKGSNVVNVVKGSNVDIRAGVANSAWFLLTWNFSFYTV